MKNLFTTKSRNTAEIIKLSMTDNMIVSIDISQLLECVT